MNQLVCPAPIATRDTVLLGHGPGGKLGGACAGCSSCRRRGAGGAA
jgi:hypothetical protein